jgi:translation initiation factor IF-1
MLVDAIRRRSFEVEPVGEVTMYKEGDRVVVTAWELDLQRTEVLQGTIVQVGKGNDLVVELDSGERRHFHTDEVQKIKS